MISEAAIAREHRLNPDLTRLQCYRNAQARQKIERMKRIRRPLDVTDGEQFPNIAEAIAHAKALRGE